MYHVKFRIYWKIPPKGSAAFVAAMEDVLEVYHIPYDPDYPMVCMDESSKQLIGEVREPIKGKPGCVKKVDDEYVRYGVFEIFMEVEPLAGKRHVAVTEHRTRKDPAEQIKQMLDERYPDARKVRLVMDNLKTHSVPLSMKPFSSWKRNAWRFTTRQSTAVG
jgi:hypothetical protein